MNAREEVVQGGIYAVVKKQDDLIMETMERHGLTPADLGCWVGQDETRLIHHKGKPLLKLWPIESTTRDENGSIIMTMTQKYKVYEYA